MTKTKIPSAGIWPNNTIDDVNGARNTLCDRNFVNFEFVLIVHPKIAELLRYNIPNSDRSYIEYLLRNGIINKMYEFTEQKNDEVTLYATVGGWPFLMELDCLTILDDNTAVVIEGVHS